MNLLLVIDMQNEFIKKEANIKKVKDLVDSKKYDNVVFTRFINDLDNPTYHLLNWAGCISDFSKQLVFNPGNHKVMDKTTYTAYNEELKDYIKENNINTIYICGVDIECCVLLTAMNLFENGYEVFILKDYVFCTRGKQRKQNALEILKRNIGENHII